MDKEFSSLFAMVVIVVVMAGLTLVTVDLSKKDCLAWPIKCAAEYGEVK